MNIFIIEDEPLAQTELSRKINERFPDMKIAGYASSVSESVSWLSNREADLIFMDVHLADGICFDIFKRIEVTTPIIFTTAYDQYAIEAFKVNSIGYLLKPIDEDDLVQAVKKLTNTPQRVEKLIDHVRSPQEYKSRIVYRLGDRIGSVNIGDIAYFMAEDKLTFAVTHTGKRYIVDYTIESLVPLLRPTDFFRITRGCITSIGAIGSVAKYFAGRLKVTLVPECAESLYVSRARVSDFVRWLDDD